MWSFVARKANKQWIWMALDVETKQVIAFYVGDRSRPERSATVAADSGSNREQASSTPTLGKHIEGVIPAARHRIGAKSTGHTNILERFNCTCGSVSLA